MPPERIRITELLETHRELRRELQSNVEKLVTAATRLSETRDTIPLAKQMAAARELAATLTSRQRQILVRIVSGESNKTVAFDLGLSTKTVETHRKRVMRKFGATSFAELVRLSMLAGLTDAPKNGSRH